MSDYDHCDPMGHRQPGGILYTPPAYTDADLRKTVQAMVRLLINKEWAEQFPVDPDARALECAISALLATHAGAAAEPSDAQIMDCFFKTTAEGQGAYMIDVGRAILALTSAPAEPPEGWKLVPIEPTNAMAVAAVSASLRDKVAINGLPQYRAMLAVAPKPPPQTPQAAGAIDAREQEAIETPFGTYPKDAWDAFEKHRIDQTLILGMPGLKSRPSFMAGWNAALASPKEAPPAAGAAQAVKWRQRAYRQGYEEGWHDRACNSAHAYLAATPAPEATPMPRELIERVVDRLRKAQVFHLAGELDAALKAAHPGERKEGE